MAIDLVSVGTAARILNVHPSTFRRWIHEGIAPVVRMSPTGHFKVPRTTIEKLLRLYGAGANKERIH